MEIHHQDLKFKFLLIQKINHFIFDIKIDLLIKN